MKSTLTLFLTVGIVLFKVDNVASVTDTGLHVIKAEIAFKSVSDNYCNPKREAHSLSRMSCPVGSFFNCTSGVHVTDGCDSNSTMQSCPMKYLHTLPPCVLSKQYGKPNFEQTNGLEGSDLSYTSSTPFMRWREKGN